MSKMQDDTGILLKTISFAAIKHAPQKRKDPEGTPYINHPIGVAVILWEAGVRDLEVLQAAVLHDTNEDTNTSLEEVPYTMNIICISFPTTEVLTHLVDNNIWAVGS